MILVGKIFRSDREAHACLLGAMLGGLLVVLTMCAAGARFDEPVKRLGCQCCYRCQCPLLGLDAHCK